MTKKTKILTIFFSLLAFVVLLVILSSTIFSVKKVSVSFESEVCNLTASESEIISSSNIKNGSSVFLVGKDAAKDNLEKTYPYIKVLSIETIFPNNITIHIIERDEVFAVAIGEKCYITDSEFKVLRIENEEYISSQTNAIKVYGFDECEAKAGDFLKIHKNYASLTTLENSFYQNYTLEESNNALVDMLAIIKSVSATKEKLSINTFYGVEVQIFDPSFNQQKKVAMLLETLKNLNSEQKSKGQINIFDKDGLVFASYKEE